MASHWGPRMSCKWKVMQVKAGERTWGSPALLGAVVLPPVFAPFPQLPSHVNHPSPIICLRYNEFGTTKTAPYCGGAVKLVNVNFAYPQALGTVIELAVRPGSCGSLGSLVPRRGRANAVSWSLSESNQHK